MSSPWDVELALDAAVVALFSVVVFTVKRVDVRVVQLGETTTHLVHFHVQGVFVDACLLHAFALDVELLLQFAEVLARAFNAVSQQRK